MSVLKLTMREISHRMLTFVLGLLSVTVAVCCLVGAVTLLRGHDLRTEIIVTEREAETREEMARLEDDYRVIMKEMGYNVLVLHKNQDFDELQRLGHSNDSATNEIDTRFLDDAVPIC